MLYILYNLVYNIYDKANKFGKNNHYNGGLAMAGLKTKIISMSNNFTANEEAIANYVLNNLGSASKAGISVLANKTGTSEASINRFCKKLGYKGFNAFKVALVQESIYSGMGSEVELDDSDAGSLAVEYNKILASTASMVDEDAMENLALRCTMSDAVYVCCSYSTKMVGAELQRRLFNLGINAMLCSDGATMAVAVNNAKKSDVAIFIVDYMFTKEYVLLFNKLKEKQCTLACVTNKESTKIVSFADIHIVIADKISTKEHIYITNAIAYLYIVDLLIAKLLRGNKSLMYRQIETDNVIRDRSAVDENIIDNY